MIPAVFCSTPDILFTGMKTFARRENSVLRAAVNVLFPTEGFPTMKTLTTGCGGFLIPSCTLLVYTSVGLAPYLISS